MIELTVTSIPFVLRILYLRWKGIPITLYNVHMALFVWLALAFIVFFTVFYYYPKSYTGFVPFRTVPVVSENGGTVVSIEVDNGTRVKPGQVLVPPQKRGRELRQGVATGLEPAPGPP